MTTRKVRAKDFFGKFDESGDGQIDSEELMKGLAETSSKPAQSHSEQFKTVRNDGNPSKSIEILSKTMKNP